jgi:hypothetical protein
MHGHHPETYNYRPACARTGLAAPRRPSLAIQKIHRLGVGVANNWLGRRTKASNPTSIKTVATEKPNRLDVALPRLGGSISPWERQPAKSMANRTVLVVFFAVFVPLSILRHYRRKRRRAALLRQLVEALRKREKPG